MEMLFGRLLGSMRLGDGGLSVLLTLSTRWPTEPRTLQGDQLGDAPCNRGDKCQRGVAEILEMVVHVVRNPPG
jgi:hypothetical protein